MGNLAKTIENRFASSVKNRVTLRCTSERTRGSPRQALRASMRVGGVLIFQTHGTIACTGVLETRGQDACRDETEHKNLIEDRFIYEALSKYSDLSIDEILASRNPIIRALGFLDARLAKSRLAKANVRNEPSIVRELFYLRCKCEGLPVVESTHVVTAHKRPKHAQVVMPDEQTRTKATLSKRKRSHDVGAILASLERGLTPDDADTRMAQLLVQALKTKKARAQFVRPLRRLLDCSKLISETYLLGVMELLSEQPNWIRPIDSWKPRSHNADKQFGSLARHLLARYEVPSFMDRAWLTGNRLHQAWFKHIGAGHNIRKAPDLPVPLTKAMAHHFLSCPGNYSIESAFRWGQALASGADRQLADAIIGTRLSETFVDNEFWLSVIGFFARNPMLDTAHIGPIVDYIWNQKYVSVMEFVERGVAVERGPAQPDFSMKGRTVNALLEQVERWHHGLSKRRAGLDLSWAKSGVKDFEFIEGSAQNKNMRIWRITELLSSRELHDEGRQMRHCVSTYAQSCYKGNCSIWSMSLKTSDGTAKILTIEERQGAIRQVRGKRNRLPEFKEREIIQRWAAQSGLAYD